MNALSCHGYTLPSFLVVSLLVSSTLVTRYCYVPFSMTTYTSSSQVGKISAAMFSFVGAYCIPTLISLFMILAMAIMIYALYTYHWRAASIRRGGRGPYDDRFGPVRLVCSLFVCQYLNRIRLYCALHSSVRLPFLSLLLSQSPSCHHRQLHPPLHTIRAIVHRSL